MNFNKAEVVYELLEKVYNSHYKEAKFLEFSTFDVVIIGKNKKNEESKFYFEEDLSKKIYEFAKKEIEKECRYAEKEIENL